MTNKPDNNLAGITLFTTIALIINALIATGFCRTGETWGQCFREWAGASGGWFAAFIAAWIGITQLKPIVSQLRHENRKAIESERRSVSLVRAASFNTYEILNQSNALARPEAFANAMAKANSYSDVVVRGEYWNFCEDYSRKLSEEINKWAELHIPFEKSYLDENREDILKRLITVRTQISQISAHFYSFWIQKNENSEYSAEQMTFSEQANDPKLKKLCNYHINEITELQKKLTNLINISK
ncbi:hypothetical protein [Roseibium sp.]|uniref:hypothetical protein n=1 Tax=Roseibium sp. TaxID=1936156 RepID=UPI003A970F2C